MTWWQDGLGGIVGHPLWIGGAMAVVTSFLSTHRHDPSMRVATRVCEAGTCALVSTMLAQAGNLYLGLSPDWAMPLGTFVGWIGTAEIKTLLAQFIERFLPHRDKAERKQ